MKILKGILAVLALLVVGFFLIGVFKPSVTYGNEIEINKSAKETWAVMMDQSKSAQWLDGLKSQELVSGEAGKIGAVSKTIMEPEGEPMFEMMETILAVKENEHIHLAFDADMMTQDVNMYFSEKGGKTTIKSEAIAKGKTMFWRSLFAIMRSGMIEQDLKMMTNLKKLVEENTTDYFPSPVVETIEDATINATQ